MRQIFKIAQVVATNAETTSNLHRWGNHFNKECVGRIDNCMSIKWNDYSSYSRIDKLNEIQTKRNDEEYGHLYKVNNNEKKLVKKKEVSEYNYQSFTKKDFEKYFNLEMTSSMLF